MFWELYQQSRIHKAEATAESASRDNLEILSTSRRQQDRIDRLTLVCNAMWSLMSEVTGLSDEQLEERIKDLDLSDGRLDGKVRASVKQCPSCDRPLSNKHTTCMYCGSEIEADPFRRVQ